MNFICRAGVCGHREHEGAREGRPRITFTTKRRTPVRLALDYYKGHIEAHTMRFPQRLRSSLLILIALYITYKKNLLVRLALAVMLLAALVCGPVLLYATAMYLFTAAPSETPEQKLIKRLRAECEALYEREHHVNKEYYIDDCAEKRLLRTP